jgi:hypothetical protein
MLFTAMQPPRSRKGSRRRRSGSDRGRTSPPPPPNDPYAPHLNAPHLNAPDPYAPDPYASSSYAPGSYAADPAGAAPGGAAPAGADPYAPAPAGAAPAGADPYAPDPAGAAPAGADPYGAAPYGADPSGAASADSGIRDSYGASDLYGAYQSDDLSDPLELDGMPRRRPRGVYDTGVGMGRDLDRAFKGAGRSVVLVRSLVALAVTAVLLIGLGALAVVFLSPTSKSRSSSPRSDRTPGDGEGGDMDSAPPRPPVITPKVPPYIPRVGTGKFIRPAASGQVAGHGKPLRYMVEVEGGLRQNPAQFARAVDRILADPRGWTAGGKWSFRRVDSGAYDFVVRLAAPGTVDKLCGAGGLDTDGEVNCSVGKQVVVNLRRWLLLTTFYRGRPAHYHALVINHEVGHRLGFKHMTCPGKGRLAPVMQQQIFGLKGCRINGWPYDTRGRFITGPAVP